MSPTDYTFQGICSSSCAVAPALTLTSITPATGPADSQNQVVLHGTGLTLATQVKLSQNGSQVGSGIQPVSVSPDGTSLQASLSTHGLAPGSYDLALAGVGYTVGTPSYGYIPGAYTVTAVPVPPVPKPRNLMTPLAPSRILDTRSGLGAAKARVGANRLVRLQVDGVAGVPAEGVTAVVLNVTAVGPTSAGFITVFPDGRNLPTASNLNFSAGQTIPNLVVVPVLNGKVDLYNGSKGTVDLIADITAYYSANGTGSALNTVGPSRILDTRSGLGAAKARVGANRLVRLQVDGVAGVPAEGVTAVVLNVTAVGPTSAGFITVFPDGRNLPTASNLNFSAGQTIPNLVVVPVLNGKVDLYNGSKGTVDLIADITAYYTAGSSGSALTSVGPSRILDTRSGLGARKAAVGARQLVRLQVAGVAGVPAKGVTAVIINVTVVGPASGGFITVFPDGRNLPTASNLNFSAGQTIPNLVVVPVIDGKVAFYNGSPGTVQIVADLAGYYTA
ncbi:hypothetical protein [Streptacidiphilus sp. MAP12-16]|uniref:hypothetical protein n=1 Tax=Streptacidiphilus sp. MAP12-16 TaxID=3156300 RepID=UPI0035157045